MAEAIEPWPFPLGRLGTLDSFVVMAQGDRAISHSHRFSKIFETLGKKILERNTHRCNFTESPEGFLELLVQVLNALPEICITGDLGYGKALGILSGCLGFKNIEGVLEAASKSLIGAYSCKQLPVIRLNLLKPIVQLFFLESVIGKLCL